MTSATTVTEAQTISDESPSEELTTEKATTIIQGSVSMPAEEEPITKTATVNETSVTTQPSTEVATASDLFVTNKEEKPDSDLKLTTPKSVTNSSQESNENAKEATTKSSATKEPSVNMPTVSSSNSSQGNDSAAHTTNSEQTFKNFSEDKFSLFFAS